jgi:hypothetical protein
VFDRALVLCLKINALVLKPLFTNELLIFHGTVLVIYLTITCNVSKNFDSVVDDR